MIKKLLLAALIVASFMQIKAQTWPHPYVINSDTVARQFLENTYWQALNDKNGSYTIETVQKEPLTDQFVYITKNSKPVFSKTTWFRFSLKNNTDKTLHLSMAANVAEADFYIPDSNRMMHHLMTGNAVTWRKKDGFKKDNAVPFEIRQGKQITIYLKTLNPVPVLSDTLKFSLLNTEKLEQSILRNYQENYTKFSDSPGLILCGIFILAGILNLLLFFTVREKAYLYFALLTLFGAFSYAHGLYDAEHVNPLLSEILLRSSYLWAFFLFLFVRSYLQVPKLYPRWNKWLFVNFGLFLLTFIVLDLLFPLYRYDFVYNHTRAFVGLEHNLVYTIFWLSFIITIIIFLLKHRQKTRLFLIGILPFTLGTAFQVLLRISALFIPSLKNTINGNRFFFGYLNGVCLLWTTAIISWDLFKHFASQEKQITQEKLEKEQLAREKEIQKRELIARQKIELEKQVQERTSELKQSLDDLKSAQAQLVHAEKMASLGELTAGIAHEIQNPLNFVNNFSEVSTELLEEMKEEIENGNLEEVKAITKDVIQNLEKILHHGKRADGIVKGMLQHSRGSSGEKVLTDINALADEYLRLSYHGLRAKNKSFNADFKLEADKSLPKIEVVPQDIGRVLLNLINNAFYAVSEKAKRNEKNFKPEVVVSTRQIAPPSGGRGVEISVKDNGNGIPDDIKEKIFQPFFTTKPTGQGTGLGLSLSYDIVKAHGGVLKLETLEGKGSSFVVELPVKQGIT